MTPTNILFEKSGDGNIKKPPINPATIETYAYVSIVAGLIGGFLMFPSPDFSKSILVGVIIPKELFGPFVAQSLLFLSFVIATFLPILVLKAKKF